MIYIENTSLSYNLVTKDGYVLASFPTKKMAEERLKELITDLFL